MHAHTTEGKSIGVVFAMIVLSILLGLVVGGAYMLMMRARIGTSIYLYLCSEDWCMYRYLGSEDWCMYRYL
jgi:hypothetical protein